MASINMAVVRQRSQQLQRQQREQQAEKAMEKLMGLGIPALLSLKGRLEGEMMASSFRGHDTRKVEGQIYVIEIALVKVREIQAQEEKARQRISEEKAAKIALKNAEMVNLALRNAFWGKEFMQEQCQAYQLWLESHQSPEQIAQA